MEHRCSESQALAVQLRALQRPQPGQQLPCSRAALTAAGAGLASFALGLAVVLGALALPAARPVMSERLAAALDPTAALADPAGSGSGAVVYYAVLLVAAVPVLLALTCLNWLGIQFFCNN